MDHQDAKPLTPNAALFGDDDDEPATNRGILNEAPQSSSKAFRRARHLADKFVHRWDTEDLPPIMRRGKWTETTEPIKVGENAASSQFIREPMVISEQGTSRCQT